VAGNVVNDDVLASVEYACHVVGAKLLVVLGHTRCGAIQAACDGVEKGHITQLLAKIQPAIAAETETTDHRTSNNVEFMYNVTELNIANTLQNIYQSSDILRLMTDQEEIGLVGAVYDVNSGEVIFKDFSSAVSRFTKKKSSKLKERLRTLINSESAPVKKPLDETHS